MMLESILTLCVAAGGPPFAMTIELVAGLLEPIGFKESKLEMLPDELCHTGREGKSAIGVWKVV
jgi:hypothetical protein